MLVVHYNVWSSNLCRFHIPEAFEMLFHFSYKCASIFTGGGFDNIVYSSFRNNEAVGKTLTLFSILRALSTVVGGNIAGIRVKLRFTKNLWKDYARQNRTDKVSVSLQIWLSFEYFSVPGVQFL